MEPHHALLCFSDNTAAFTPPATSSATVTETIRYEKMGIGEVRQLKERSYRTPEGDAQTQRLVVILGAVTVEAQQALLKLTEEPPQSTSFLFVLPTGTQLLPTLLSRFEVICEDSPEEREQVLEVLLKAPIGKRLDIIEGAVKNKDADWQLTLKTQLLTYLTEGKKDYSATDLERLHFVASTLLTRGAANKMLLEELALTL